MVNGLAEPHCLQRVGTAVCTNSSQQQRTQSWGFHTFAGGVVAGHSYFLRPRFVCAVDTHMGGIFLRIGRPYIPRGPLPSRTPASQRSANKELGFPRRAYLSFLSSVHAFLIAFFLITLRHLYLVVEFQNMFVLIVRSGLCCRVFVPAVHFTCFTH